METLKNIILRNWFGLVIAIIIFVFLLQQCEANERSEANITALTTENTTYKNKLGTITTVNQTLQLTANQLKKTVINKDQKIKILTAGFTAVHTIIKTNTITKIDTIKIPFDVPIPQNFYREGAIFQDWYTLGYKVDSIGVTIEPITIPNEQITVVGFKKKWFLGKQYLTTEVTNTNPLIENTNVQSFETVVPVKWYERKILWFSAGAILTALIVK